LSVNAPRVYLSGAIEHATDLGTGWRAAVGRFLAGELGHDVYDPSADEKKSLSEEERAGFRRWKTENPERFRTVVRKIIVWDLERVELQTDYVVAFWDAAAARGGGTAAEITLAHRLGKPVYLVLGMPVAEASGWILAAADEVFGTFGELEDALRRRYADSRHRV
jgi:nucleoside 2-deoxyribosyltransferase